MSLSCPVSFEKVNATIVRINALNVTLLLLLFLVTEMVLPLYILLLDFNIRLFADKRYSPLYQLSCALLNLFHLKSIMEDAAAKRLAAYFGLLFTLTTLSNI